MDLCLMIEGQEGVSWEQWQALAAACEEHGIPTLFRSDHYIGFREPHNDVLDAWSTVTALAATTTSLRLGTLVSPGTFRHPSVLAKMAASADQISGGRIEVGLGAGWNDREHTAFGLPFPDMGTRFSIHEEQLAIVRGLWGPGTFTFDGEHYQLDGIDAHPKPVQDPMPLIVGGKALPRSVDLAVRYADEYNTVFCPPAVAAERRGIVMEACERAGRDPATMRFSVMVTFMPAADEGELRARTERMRAIGHEPDPDVWIMGLPDQAGARLRELADAGCDRVMLQMLLHDDVDQIALAAQLAEAVS
ncbi:MAG TPA: TIGR03560 family F420-dependent LLM class oxidoreductase [Capillimicrobium sp.]|nr:TIGR03560 family F420-dependent LLM class oxidoreductase [Capillimicrobium sp.]